MAAVPLKMTGKLQFQASIPITLQRHKRNLLDVADPAVGESEADEVGDKGTDGSHEKEVRKTIINLAH